MIDLGQRQATQSENKRLLAASKVAPCANSQAAPARKRAIILAALGEAVTGLALVVVPSLVGRLLLGEELTGVAVPVARVAGIALIALAVACWPGPPRIGMLIYVGVVALYLAYVSFAGSATGTLLWSAVVVHAMLTALLIWAITSDKAAKT